MHIARAALCLAALLLAVGCASTSDSRSTRPFDFQTDTFCYPNQLVWEYRLDPATGKTITSKREPPPTYTHRCFVVVRASRQFFDHARFDPGLSRSTNYDSIVRQVLARNPRKESPEAARIIIPGYANLREFSRDHAQLLQRECGGAWQSYFQRGHWRMIFPFTRKHQERTAGKLLAEVKENRPHIVHLVRFPSLAINHAMLIYRVEQTPGQIRFHAYDPNDPNTPATLTFSRQDCRFALPANSYFPAGGRVDIFPIFTGFLY